MRSADEYLMGRSFSLCVNIIRPFLASAYRIRRFVREHAFADRPHTSLWLAKHMLSLLACMVVKYGVLFFAGGQGIL